MSYPSADLVHSSPGERRAAPGIRAEPRHERQGSAPSWLPTTDSSRDRRRSMPASSRAEIRHLLRIGVLILVRRGVYADAEVWDSLDEYVGRPRLRTRAALATMRRGWVVESRLRRSRARAGHPQSTRSTRAHHSSGLHGCLDQERREAPPGAVRRGPGGRAERAQGARHGQDGRRHRTRARDAVRRDRLRLRHAARRDPGSPGSCGRADAYWPYVAAARAAVEFADPGAESVLETLGRLLVKALGVGRLRARSSRSRSTTDGSSGAISGSGATSSSATAR